MGTNEAPPVVLLVLWAALGGARRTASLPITVLLCYNGATPGVVAGSVVCVAVPVLVVPAIPLHVLLKEIDVAVLRGEAGDSQGLAQGATQGVCLWHARVSSCNETLEP